MPRAARAAMPRERGPRMIYRLSPMLVDFLLFYVEGIWPGETVRYAWLSEIGVSDRGVALMRRANELWRDRAFEPQVESCLHQLNRMDYELLSVFFYLLRDHYGTWVLASLSFIVHAQPGTWPAWTPSPPPGRSRPCAAATRCPTASPSRASSAAPSSATPWPADSSWYACAVSTAANVHPPELYRPGPRNQVSVVVQKISSPLALFLFLSLGPSILSTNCPYSLPARAYLSQHASLQKRYR